MIQKASRGWIKASVLCLALIGRVPAQTVDGTILGVVVDQLEKAGVR